MRQHEPQISVRYPSFELDHLAHLIRSDRECDFHSVRRAARQRLSKMRRLLCGYLWWHRWFVGIDHGFDENRTLLRQGFAQRLAACGGVVNGEPCCAAGTRNSGKVN